MSGTNTYSEISSFSQVHVPAVVSDIPEWSPFRTPVPLIAAIEDGDIDKVKELLEKGDDPNESWTTSSPLNVALIMGFQAIVEELIKAGADVNKPVEKFTPLYYAAQNGRQQLVELLLKAGANIKNPDEPGFTSLWKATSRDYPNIMLLLIRAGAPIPNPDELRAKGDIRGAANAEILQQYIREINASYSRISDRARGIIIQKTKKEGAPAIFTDDYVKDQQKLIELRYKLVGDLKQLKSAIDEGQKVLSEIQEATKFSEAKSETKGMNVNNAPSNAGISTEKEKNLVHKMIDAKFNMAKAAVDVKMDAPIYHLFAATLTAVQHGEKPEVVAALRSRAEKASRRSDYDPAKSVNTNIKAAKNITMLKPILDTYTTFSAKEEEALNAIKAAYTRYASAWTIGNEKSNTNKVGSIAAYDLARSHYDDYRKLIKTAAEVSPIIALADKLHLPIEKLYLSDLNYNTIIKYFIEHLQDALDLDLYRTIDLYNEQLKLLNTKPGMTMNLNEAGPASPKRSKLNTTNIKYPPVLPNSVYNTIIRKYLGGQHKHNTKKHRHVSNRRPTKNTRRY